MCFANDCGCGDGSEVASIETVGDGRVHEKYFVCANVAAALPDWQLATQAITFTRLANSNTIDDDFAADATDALTGQVLRQF